MWHVVTGRQGKRGLVFYSTLLAGLLSAPLAVVCVHDPVQTHPAKTCAPGAGKGANGQKPLSVHDGDAHRDLVRLRAEVAANKAAGLRQKQTKRDLAAAIALLRKSAQLFKAANVNSKAADANLKIREIYFTFSQYDKAMSSYREARDLGSKNPELLCLVLSRMARTYATTGQQSEANKTSSQALSQCDGITDPRLQAEVFEARGEVLDSLGESAKSTEFLNRAQELFGEAADKSGQARAQLNLAYVRFKDDRAEALRLAGKALLLWSSIGDRHGVAEARTALGTFAALTDEFETARCNYELSLPVFRSLGDNDNEAIVLSTTVLCISRRMELLMSG